MQENTGAQRGGFESPAVNLRFRTCRYESGIVEAQTRWRDGRAENQLAFVEAPKRFP